MQPQGFWLGFAEAVARIELRPEQGQHGFSIIGGCRLLAGQAAGGGGGGGWVAVAAAPAGKGLPGKAAVRGGWVAATAAPAGK